MKTTSFLLGIIVIIGGYEVRQVTSTSRDFIETFHLPCGDYSARLMCALMPYRTFDGTCNNLCNITRGAIFHPLQRLETLEEPTAYEPGFKPRSRAVSGRRLPNARTVSRKVFVSSSNLDINGTAPNFTHLTMTWGQFLDHDITLTEVEEVEEGGCGTNDQVCPRRPECISIDINPGDGLEVNPTFKCIPTSRSIRDSKGQQRNVITTYIDGSQVYGSTLQVAKRLRGRFGFLDVYPFRDFGNDKILPRDDETFCRSVRRDTEPCFLAGDIRSNENHALTTMHVVWVREHNRIVRALRSLNPQWSDERLFQEARKIVGAELQHITYNEWLPVFFDEDLRRKSGLLLEREDQFFDGYDPSENAEMINSCSTGALRMGHSLVRNEFTLRDTLFRERGFPERVIPVKDFYDPAPFFRQGNNPFGGIVNGLVLVRARQVDHIFAPAVREFLNFDGPGFNGSFGDLMALNVNRGRDHGLPPYVKFREACGAKPASRFSDLLDTISPDRIIILKGVYDNAKDIDLFAGAMNEFPTKGSVLGFTFTCILREQFRRLRAGDRFWYERKHENGFNMDQLTEIRKVTMGRVFCDNVGLTQFVPPNAFEVTPNRRAVNCDSLPVMDLGVFREGAGAGESQAGEGEWNAPAGA